MQNVNKPWPCGFKKDMTNWVNFHQSTKKSENCTLMCFYAQITHCFSQKISKELCAIKLKGIAKFWKFALWLDSFIQSIQIFRWKSTEELCLMTLKSDAKFEGKLTFGSKNDLRNLMDFNASSGKSRNLNFDVLLFPITHKVSAEKVQKSYLSWQWKKILWKLWRKTDFLFENWDEEFGKL